MSNRTKLIGKWKTREIVIIFPKVEYTITFRSDGSLLIIGRYKNPLVQAAMAFWDLKMTGNWELTSDDRLSVELNKITTYPTKLIDQALKTLKIHISAEEFVSAIFSSVVTLLVNHGHGSKVTFPDENTLVLGDERMRRVN